MNAFSYHPLASTIMLTHTIHILAYLLIQNTHTHVHMHAHAHRHTPYTHEIEKGTKKTTVSRVLFSRTGSLQGTDTHRA